jgi:acyl-CoA synthetase (AMP-forming)/AMP-acid ligase II
MPSLPNSTKPLLSWLERPAVDRGIRFAQADGEWCFYPYEQVAKMTREAARGLTQHGVRPGDVVTLIAETGPELIAAFFGALAIGATPSPAAPPMIFKELDRYREHLARVLDATRPALVVAGEGLAGAIESIGGGSLAVVELAALFGGGGELTPWSAGAGEIALLQLTSGSTGAARAVSISHSALTANVGALSRWLGIAPGSAWGSWLPLHHDMGLVGGMIAPVVYETDLWLMRPEQFVRDPLGYLRCFGTFGARLSATPPFALDLIARRVKADALEGMDFSRVEGIVVGAERISPGTLERFHALLGPFGLRREALLPAYGLAEATLAVSGVPRGRGWESTVVDSASLALGRRIRRPEAGGEGTAVVGCGLPLDGVSVSVVDEDLVPVGEGWVGEIVVRGASLASGLAGDAPASLTRLADGELRTGDAGWVADGQLFVIGRLGDSIKVRGQVVFSEDLEAALAEMGAGRQHVAVLLGVLEGLPNVVVLSEEADHDWRDSAATLLRRQAGGARVTCLNVPRGTITRTSSGKPRRRALWQSFVEGTLTAAPHRHLDDAIA